MAVVVAAAVACSVPGRPIPAADLSERAVPVTDFPYGRATSMSGAAARGVLADITFRPLRGGNDPADCTPAPVDADSAVVRVGPGGAAGGTLTVLLVRATDGFADYVDGARRCGEFALGGTVGTVVHTQVRDVDDDAGIARIDRTVRMGVAQPGFTAPQSAITEWMAQRGDIRVYVHNRRPADAGELSDGENSATRALFDDARRRAFAAPS